MLPRDSARRSTSEGLVDRCLAKLRSRRADGLIPEEHRAGRILDLGCGQDPTFLRGTRFSEKFGIDRREVASLARPRPPCTIVRHDLDTAELPFPSAFFDVVSALAVIEHLAPEAIRPLFAEIHRVLRPGGIVIATTPARWFDPVLRWLARVRLVCPEQIDEHKSAFTRADLRALLEGAGFDPASIRTGSFELRANLWVAAVR